jgi:protein-S-isoprenylcysteine O-methyltransferase Ste14
MMTTILCLVRGIFAQWVVIFYPGVLVFWLIVHNNIERLRTVGIRAYWIAAVAWGVTSGPLLFFRREIFSVRWPMPGLLAGLTEGFGVIAFFVALFFLLSATKQISTRTMVGLPELEPHKNNQPVLNAGIYSKTRNPIYFAHWLLVFSSAAVTDFAANWILFALDCIALPLLIRAEERELLTRYGPDYTTYMRRVPRFFPQLR